MRARGWKDKKTKTRSNDGGDDIRTEESICKITKKMSILCWHRSSAIQDGNDIRKLHQYRKWAISRTNKIIILKPKHNSFIFIWLLRQYQNTESAWTNCCTYHLDHWQTRPNPTHRHKHTFTSTQIQVGSLSPPPALSVCVCVWMWMLNEKGSKTGLK